MFEGRATRMCVYCGMTLWVIARDGHMWCKQVAEEKRRGAVAQGVVTYSRLDSSQSQPVGGLPIASHGVVQPPPQEEGNTPLEAADAAQQQQERAGQQPALALEVGCTQEILSRAAASTARSRALAAQECRAMLQSMQDRAAWASMTVWKRGWCVSGLFVACACRQGEELEALRGRLMEVLKVVNSSLAGQAPQ